MSELTTTTSPTTDWQSVLLCHDAAIASLREGQYMDAHAPLVNSITHLAHRRGEFHSLAIAALHAELARYSLLLAARELRPGQSRSQAVQNAYDHHYAGHARLEEAQASWAREPDWLEHLTHSMRGRLHISQATVMTTQGALNIAGGNETHLRDARSHYHEAYNEFANANDGLHAAATAIAASRNEQLLGHHVQRVLWLARAAGSLVFTARHEGAGEAFGDLLAVGSYLWDTRRARNDPATILCYPSETPSYIPAHTYQAASLSTATSQLVAG